MKVFLKLSKINSALGAIFFNKPKIVNNEGISYRIQNQNGLISVFHYKEVSKFLKMIKYKGINSVTNIFSQAVIDELIAIISDVSQNRLVRQIIIIPFPQSLRRKIFLNIDHTKIICQTIEKELKAVFYHKNGGIDVKLISNAVYRLDFSKQQAGSNKNSRLKKHFKFQISEKWLRSIDWPKQTLIFIVDDVVSTGATAKALMSELKESLERRFQPKNQPEVVFVSIAWSGGINVVNSTHWRRG